MAQSPLPQGVSATQSTAKETDGTKGRGQGCWFCLKTALNEPSQIMCSAGLNLQLGFKLWCRGCYLVRKNCLAGSELGLWPSAPMTKPSWKCSIMLFLEIQHPLIQTLPCQPCSILVLAGGPGAPALCGVDRGHGKDLLQESPPCRKNSEYFPMGLSPPRKEQLEPRRREVGSWGTEGLLMQSHAACMRQEKSIQPGSSTPESRD